MEREQIYNIIRQCNMHRQKVLGVCMRYFGFSIDDAEDCVQEAFFSLYDIWHKGKKYKTPWLGYTKSPLIKANDSSVHSNKKGFTISQPQKKWNNL